MAACLNAPGFVFAKSYQLNKRPATMFEVRPCGDDEYSTGLDGATACRACPTGFRTDPLNEAGSHTSVAVCKAPPGHYIGGEAVLPCPVGAFSANYTLERACDNCEDVFGPGVSTEREGSNSSSNCNVLEPGRAFVDRSKVVTDEDDDGGSVGGIRIIALDSGNTTKACPQSFYW
jgi:hypothetical protein